MLPRIVVIQNLTHPLAKPLSVELCNSFFTRLKGLMFSPAIQLENGILIDEAADSTVNSSIHMFFMNFDIATIWINSQLKVVDTTLAKRWHPIYAPKSPARYILEIHPGRLDDFHQGDQISLYHE